YSSYTLFVSICDFILFFFTPTSTPELYTLSLHDALPISPAIRPFTFSESMDSGRIRTGCRDHSERNLRLRRHLSGELCRVWHDQDRKSTRLNSSHVSISYAVFCLKKKIYIFINHNHMATR